MTVRPPAPRPCASCPYQLDAPSGVWAASEYAKLPPYDEPTFTQPTALFLCHQHDHGDDRARVCAGWAGCHDGDELLALRMAAMTGEASVETVEAIRDYVSPVPLHETGTEAAAHGMRDLHAPGPDARTAIDKISRTRGDLTTG
jgi:hypothetical protein